MALPADIQAMTQAQAEAELYRLDALDAQRGLNRDEQLRLLALEDRLEQFVDPEELARAAEYTRRAEAGENVFHEELLENYSGPMETVSVNITSHNYLGWGLLAGAVLLLLKASQKKGRRS